MNLKKSFLIVLFLITTINLNTEARELNILSIGDSEAESMVDAAPFSPFSSVFSLVGYFDYQIHAGNIASGQLVPFSLGNTTTSHILNPSVGPFFSPLGNVSGAAFVAAMYALEGNHVKFAKHAKSGAVSGGVNPMFPGSSYGDGEALKQTLESVYNEFLSEAGATQPDVIFINLGINDLGLEIFGNSNNQPYEDMIIFLDYIRGIFSDSVIVYELPHTGLNIATISAQPQSIQNLRTEVTNWMNNDGNNILLDGDWFSRSDGIHKDFGGVWEFAKRSKKQLDLIL